MYTYILWIYDISTDIVLFVINIMNIYFFISLYFFIFLYLTWPVHSLDSKLVYLVH